MKSTEAKRAEIQRLLLEYENDPALLDLRSDVALLRLMRDKARACLESDEPMSKEKHGFLLEIVSETSRVLDRKSRIDSNHALTAHHVALMRAAILEIFARLPEDVRAPAFEYFSASVLGADDPPQLPAL